jgi:hypothetical protein
MPNSLIQRRALFAFDAVRLVYMLLQLYACVSRYVLCGLDHLPPDTHPHLVTDGGVT